MCSVRDESLPRLVESIVGQTFADWELIVGAQGANPTLYAYLERVSKACLRIRALELTEFGLSRARNACVRAAEGAIVAFTDDDCEADPSWLERIHDAFAAEPSVGLVAGDWYRSAANPGFDPAYVRLPSPSIASTDPPRRAFVGRRAGTGPGRTSRSGAEVFERVGGFDESLGPGTPFPAAEDTDFGLRAEALNVAMWTRPDIRVYHSGGRRVGLLPFLRHHRAYATGRDASREAATFIPSPRGGVGAPALQSPAPPGHHREPSPGNA